MKGRTLVLFLLAYLSLDLGNPFMPGAVSLVDGQLEVIDAGRPVGIHLPVLDGAGLSRGEPTVARPAARPSPAGERRRRWWIPAGRVFSITPAPAPSPDDD